MPCDRAPCWREAISKTRCRDEARDVGRNAPPPLDFFVQLASAARPKGPSLLARTPGQE
jgi:hypothetical protein